MLKTHLSALQASIAISVPQLNIKNHNLHKATNFKKYYTETQV